MFYVLREVTVLSSGAGEEPPLRGGAQLLAGGYAAAREWRGRRPRDPRPQRRIAPERYLNGSYPFQVKFTPDDLLNGETQHITCTFIPQKSRGEKIGPRMGDHL